MAKIDERRQSAIRREQKQIQDNYISNAIQKEQALPASDPGSAPPLIKPSVIFLYSFNPSTKIKW